MTSYWNQESHCYILHGTPWSKKGDDNFDVAMGAYDGAEICELIGLFMLSQLKQFDSLIGGLYRDDGLIVTNLSPRETEKIKKTICEIFRKNYLSISIQANLTTVRLP